MTDRSVKKSEELRVIELAGAVIKDPQGRLLLLHRKESGKTGNARYETVGGGLEDSETVAQAAEREALEELNLKIKTSQILGRATFIENGITFGYTWVEAEIIEGEPRVMEEDKFDGFGYFSWEQMDGMKDQLSPNALNLLNAYQQGEIN